MTSQRDLVWTPFWALTFREVKRFLKVAVQTVYMPIVNSGLYLLIFGVSIGQYITLPNGLPYLAFLIPGLVMMGALNNALMNSSSSIITAKFSGELEDIRVVPLSTQNIVWAMAFGALVRGLLVGIVTFIVGAGFYWLQIGDLLSIKHPFLLLYFLCVGNLAFGKLGIAVAIWARNFDHVATATALIITPLLYLGGVFYSLKSLSPFWQTVSHFNPLVYMINGVRYGILGVSDVNITLCAVIVAIALIFSHVLALASLRYGSYNRW
ncbi:MAG: ABC transporter permease [Proteobacteria bacterium SG_bin7]|nr:MAG: ABC transporter permease [Proteobacteria bacterium SG_bin7]